MFGARLLKLNQNFKAVPQQQLGSVLQLCPTFISCSGTRALVSVKTYIQRQEGVCSPEKRPVPLLLESESCGDDFELSRTTCKTSSLAALAAA